ncbi:MAG: PH domain-containing protein [Rikenellaceae bacterium]
MKYRSRISVILFILIFGVTVFPLIFDGENLFAKSMVEGIVYLFIVLISLSVFVSINYTITENSLIVRVFGFKMATIDIAKIKTIKRSYCLLSSPAASLKRLEFKFYHKGRLETAIISPVREAEFLERLKEINPNIETNVEIGVVQRRNILRFWDWDI